MANQSCSAATGCGLHAINIDVFVKQLHNSGVDAVLCAVCLFLASRHLAATKVASAATLRGVEGSAVLIDRG